MVAAGEQFSEGFYWGIGFALAGSIFAIAITAATLFVTQDLRQPVGSAFR